jgi:hypothetical protein
LQDYQLLSPEEAAEEIYPYRRVWRSLITEMTLLGGVIAIILIADLLGFVPNTYNPILLVLLSLFPIGLFYWISLRGEQDALQPRPHLLRTLIYSVILTNGVAITLINNVFTPAIWLHNVSFFGRLFGYMFTLGILAEFLKYALVRYTLFPDHFRIRIDGIAYCIPAALGYALVLNLRFVLLDEPTLTAAAIRILVNNFSHIAIGTIMGYFLSEIAFERTSIYWLPLGLFISALVSGIYAAFRVITIVSGLNVASTGNRPIGVVFLVIGFAIAILGIIAFLIESADARLADKQGVRRIR